MQISLFVVLIMACTVFHPVMGRYGSGSKNKGMKNKVTNTSSMELTSEVTDSQTQTVTDVGTKSGTASETQTITDIGTKSGTGSETQMITDIITKSGTVSESQTISDIGTKSGTGLCGSNGWNPVAGYPLEFAVGGEGCDSANFADSVALCRAHNSVPAYIPDANFLDEILKISGATNKFWTGLQRGVTQPYLLDPLWSGDYTGGYRIVSTYSTDPLEKCMYLNPVTKKLQDSDCSVVRSIVCTRETIVNLTWTHSVTELIKEWFPATTMRMTASHAPSSQFSLTVTPKHSGISFVPPFFTFTKNIGLNATFTLTPTKIGPNETIVITETKLPEVHRQLVRTQVTAEPFVTVVKCIVLITNYSTIYNLTVGQSLDFALVPSCALLSNRLEITFSLPTGSPTPPSPPWLTNVTSNRVTWDGSGVPITVNPMQYVRLTASAAGLYKVLYNQSGSVCPGPETSSTCQYIQIPESTLSIKKNTVSVNETNVTIFVHSTKAVALELEYPIHSGTLTIDCISNNTVAVKTTTLNVTPSDMARKIFSIQPAGIGSGKLSLSTLSTDYMCCTPQNHISFNITGADFIVVAPPSMAVYSGQNVTLWVQPKTAPLVDGLTLTLASPNCPTGLSVTTATALIWNKSTTTNLSVVILNTLEGPQTCRLTFTLGGTSMSEYNTIGDQFLTVLPRRSLALGVTPTHTHEAYERENYTATVTLLDLVKVDENLTVTPLSNASCAVIGPQPNHTFTIQDPIGSTRVFRITITQTVQCFMNITFHISGAYSFRPLTQPGFLAFQVMTQQVAALDFCNESNLPAFAFSRSQISYVGQVNKAFILMQSDKRFPVNVSLVTNATLNQTDFTMYANQPAWFMGTATQGTGAYIWSDTPGVSAVSLAVQGREFALTSAPNQSLILTVLPLKVVRIIANITMVKFGLFVGSLNNLTLNISITPLTSAMVLTVNISNTTQAALWPNLGGSDTHSLRIPYSASGPTFVPLQLMGYHPGTVSVTCAVSGPTATQFEIPTEFQAQSFTFQALRRVQWAAQAFTQDMEMDMIIIPEAVLGSVVEVWVTCPFYLASMVNITVGSPGGFFLNSSEICQDITSRTLKVILVPLKVSKVPTSLVISLSGVHRTIFETNGVGTVSVIYPAKTGYVGLTQNVSFIAGAANKLETFYKITEKVTSGFLEIFLWSNCTDSVTMSAYNSKTDPQSSRLLFQSGETTLLRTIFLIGKGQGGWCSIYFNTTSNSTNFTLTPPDLVLYIEPLRWVNVSGLPTSVYRGEQNNRTVWISVEEMPKPNRTFGITVQFKNPNSDGCFFSSPGNNSLQFVTFWWNNTGSLTKNFTFWVNSSLAKCTLSYTALGNSTNYNLENLTDATVLIRPFETVTLRGTHPTVIYLQPENSVDLYFTCSDGCPHGGVTVTPNSTYNSRPGVEGTLPLVNFTRINATLIKVQGLRPFYGDKTIGLSGLDITYTITGPSYYVTTPIIVTGVEVKEISGVMYTAPTATQGYVGASNTAGTRFSLSVTGPPSGNQFLNVSVDLKNSTTCMCEPMFAYWNAETPPTAWNRQFVLTGLTEGSCEVRLVPTGTTYNLKVIREVNISIAFKRLLQMHWANSTGHPTEPPKFMFVGPQNSIKLMISTITNSYNLSVLPIPQTCIKFAPELGSNNATFIITFDIEAVCSPLDPVNVTFAFVDLPSVFSPFLPYAEILIQPQSKIVFAAITGSLPTSLSQTSCFTKLRLGEKYFLYVTVLKGLLPFQSNNSVEQHAGYRSVIITPKSGNDAFYSEPANVTWQGSHDKEAFFNIIPKYETLSTNLTLTLSGPSASLFLTDNCTGVSVEPTWRSVTIVNTDSANGFVRNMGMNSDNGKSITVLFPNHSCALGASVRPEIRPENDLDPRYRNATHVAFKPAVIANPGPPTYAARFTVVASRPGAVTIDFSAVPNNAGTMCLVNYSNGNGVRNAIYNATVRVVLDPLLTITLVSSDKDIYVNERVVVNVSVLAPLAMNQSLQLSFAEAAQNPPTGGALLDFSPKVMEFNTSSSYQRELRVRGITQGRTTVYAEFLNGSVPFYSIVENISFSIYNRKTVKVVPCEGSSPCVKEFPTRVFLDQINIGTIVLPLPALWVNVSLQLAVEDNSTYMLMEPPYIIVNASDPEFMFKSDVEVPLSFKMTTVEYYSKPTNLFLRFTGPSTREYPERAVMSRLTFVPRQDILVCQPQCCQPHCSASEYIYPIQFLGNSFEVTLSLNAPSIVTAPRFVLRSNVSGLLNFMTRDRFQTEIKFVQWPLKTTQLNHTLTIWGTKEPTVVDPLPYEVYTLLWFEPDKNVAAPPDINQRNLTLGVFRYQSKIQPMMTLSKPIIFYGLDNKVELEVIVPHLLTYIAEREKTASLKVTCFGSSPDGRAELQFNSSTNILNNATSNRIVVSVSAHNSSEYPPYAQNSTTNFVGPAEIYVRFDALVDADGAPTLQMYDLSPLKANVLLVPKLYPILLLGTVQVSSINLYVSPGDSLRPLANVVFFSLQMVSNFNYIDKFITFSYTITKSPTAMVEILCQNCLPALPNTFFFEQTEQLKQFQLRMKGTGVSEGQLLFRLSKPAVPIPQVLESVAMNVTVRALRKVRINGFLSSAIYTKGKELTVTVYPEEPPLEGLLLQLVINVCQSMSVPILIARCEGMSDSLGCTEIVWTKKNWMEKKTIQFAPRDTSVGLLNYLNCSVHLQTRGDDSFEQLVLRDNLTYAPVPKVEYIGQPLSATVLRSEPSVTLEFNARFTTFLPGRLNITMSRRPGLMQEPSIGYTIVLIVPYYIFSSVKNFSISLERNVDPRTLKITIQKVPEMPVLLNDEQFEFVFRSTALETGEVYNTSISAIVILKKDSVNVETIAQDVADISTVASGALSGVASAAKLRTLLASTVCPLRGGSNQWIKTVDDMPKLSRRSHFFQNRFPGSPTSLALVATVATMNLFVPFLVLLAHSGLVVIAYAYRNQRGYSSKTWPAAAAAARFPNVGLAAFFVFFQQGITTSLQVIMYSDSDGYRGLCYFTLFCYLTLLPGILVWINTRKGKDGKFLAKYKKSTDPPLCGLLYEGRYISPDNNDFVHKFGQIFEYFREGMHWYQLLELFFVFFFGAIDAFVPTTTGQCIVIQSHKLAIFLFQAFFIWYYSPYDGLLDKLYFRIASIVQLGICLFILVGQSRSESEQDFYTDSAVSVLNGSAWVMTVKAFLDMCRMIVLICPCFDSNRVPKQPEGHFRVKCELDTEGEEMKKLDRHEGLDLEKVPGTLMMQEPPTRSMISDLSLIAHNNTKGNAGGLSEMDDLIALGVCPSPGLGWEESYQPTYRSAPPRVPPRLSMHDVSGGESRLYRGTIMHTSQKEKEEIMGTFANRMVDDSRESETRRMPHYRQRQFSLL